VFDDMLDDAVFAGCVAALDQHKHAFTMLDQVALKLHELDL